MLLPIIATARPIAHADTTTQWQFVEQPLREVLAVVEAQTGLRFLYRDALIAGINVTLRTTGTIVDALRDVLHAHGLRLQVDARRQQALITRRPTADSEPRPPPLLTGVVLDAANGTPLPLATLTWTTEGMPRGVAANDEGQFRIRLHDALARRDTLHLRVSYVGYAPQIVHLPLHPLPSDVSVRLQRNTTTAPDVVVQSEALASEVDPSWRTLMRPSLHASLGEPGVMRALQPLPSVTITPTLADGTIVRGSPADGFDVRLDGMKLFNQSHLFGLVDALNDDVLQTVGFYYGVPPVHYPGSPGGTLDFRTRTGSRTSVQGNVGLSTMTAEAMLEGPLADGRASWMLSARRSLLDALRWPGTEALLDQGVGVAPDATDPPLGQDLALNNLRPETPQALFYDVHGAVALSLRNGGEITFSAYAGGDDVEQQAQRLFVTSAASPFRDRRFDLEPVASASQWGNEAASLRAHLPLTSRLYTQQTLAISRYHAEFRRSGFATANLRVDDPAPFQSEFRTENDLRLGHWTQRFDWRPSFGGTWTLGTALMGYDLTYAEARSDTTRYRQNRQAGQADAFAEATHHWTPWLTTRLGMRTHAFSRGPFVRLSPRLQATFTPASRLSFGLGYSRTHQFVHRLSQEGANTLDVWVMSSERQPPHAADHLTGRLTAQLTPNVAVQVEGYWKEQRDVRLYLSQMLGIANIGRATSDLFPSSRPFIGGNTLRTRGLETMLRVQKGSIDGTVSYTYSTANLHRTTNDGASAEWPAPWAHPHQVTARMVIPMGRHLTGVVTGLYASGAPNVLARLDRTASRAAVDSHLRPYHRVDVGLKADGTWQNTQWTLRATVQNVYNRHNPWYREAVAVLVPTPSRPQVTTALREVYDLGIQPAVAVSVRW